MENTTSIDIIGLIENNPISKINITCKSKLIEKIQSKFTSYEQQLFLSSFYCYLKYDKINDFVINLDDIWEWLGFSKKYHAKYLLEKQFIIDKDYKILLPKLRQQDFMKKNDDEIVLHPKKESKSSHGGHNKETIMMNIQTFKKFCLKAGTKKADEIHDYFIKLEESLNEILEEETTELKTQLLQIEDKFENQRELDKEKLLLQKFASIGSIVYIIRVKILEHGNYIVKIGESRIGIKNRYAEQI